MDLIIFFAILELSSVFWHLQLSNLNIFLILILDILVTLHIINFVTCKKKKLRNSTQRKNFTMLELSKFDCFFLTTGIIKSKRFPYHLQFWHLSPAYTFTVVKIFFLTVTIMTPVIIVLIWQLSNRSFLFYLLIYLFLFVWVGSAVSSSSSSSWPSSYLYYLRTNKFD